MPAADSTRSYSMALSTMSVLSPKHIRLHPVTQKAEGCVHVQLQNRKQNNPLILSGVFILLISLLVRVPLWMWTLVLGLAGMRLVHPLTDPDLHQIHQSVSITDATALFPLCSQPFGGDFVSTVLACEFMLRHTYIDIQLILDRAGPYYQGGHVILVPTQQTACHAHLAAWTAEVHTAFGGLRRGVWGIVCWCYNTTADTHCMTPCRRHLRGQHL